MKEFIVGRRVPLIHITEYKVMADNLDHAMALARLGQGEVLADETHEASTGPEWDGEEVAA